jgi:hypothetical protein
MRGLSVGLIVLALLASAVWLWQGSGVAPPDPLRAATGSTTAGVGPDEVGWGLDVPRSEPTEPALPRQPMDLAATPTACLRVVDAAVGVPLEGVAVYRFRAGFPEVALGFSDAAGMVELPLSEPGQLIVALSGYLLRLAPTALGTTADQPQTVRLVQDAFSVRSTFSFRKEDGSKPDVVHVMLAPVDDDAVRDGVLPAAVRAGDAVVRRAWGEHATVAAMQAVPGIALQAGRHNASQPMRLAAREEVTFLSAGVHRYVAVTVDGLAAAGEFDPGRTPELSVTLTKGRELAGQVRDAVTDKVLAAADVATTAGDPLLMTTRTDAEGRFVIGPVANVDLALTVTHGEFEPGAAQGLRPGVLAVVRLQPLPGETLRGRILEAGIGSPLVGALVSTVDAAGQPVQVRSGRDGGFALPVAGREAIRLTVAMEGFLPHVELLGADDPPRTVELWPGSTEARMQAGLTGLLRGLVVDTSGRPLSGMPIRFVPDQPDPRQGSLGRRVLQSGIAAVPGQVTTAPDGSFVLETTAEGQGLIAVTAGPFQGRGTRAQAIRGRAMSGVRIELVDR